MTSAMAACPLLVFALLLTTLCADAVVLKAEHHGEEHPEHGRIGAVYRFSLDNYDENNVSKGPATDLMVETKFPAGTKVEESYYYEEGFDSGDESYRECMNVKPDGDDRVLVRCKVNKVIEHVTYYVHVHFPKEKFKQSDLADLERAGTKVVASLSQKNVHVNDASLPLLKHWREEL